MKEQPTKEKKRCTWCTRGFLFNPKWEQKVLGSDKYEPLCTRCANRRLRNPYNALLDMRKITI